MDGTGAQQPAHLTRMRLPNLIVHVAQIVLATTVLGLAAYGVDYISYNVLIYSLVVVRNTLSLNTKGTKLRVDYLQSWCIFMDDRLSNLSLQI